MLKRYSPILIGIAFLFVSFLPAQSPKWKAKRMRNQQMGSVVAMTYPTRVTGEATTTSSGVRYWDIQVGSGNTAEKGHAVKLLYAAWVENGKEFADSRTDGKSTIFTVGAGQVIPGWEQGVEGMKAGGKRQIHIPPQLAYGAAGLPPGIPPNSSLIFDVELLEVQ